ncbi:ATP-grasp domain-containing protein, partial [Piscirickettsia salmonis]|uniref:ATP-grasp domain-containing protein n=1 Tax=Piscirickettsia salmonis TaxID=1238 RepID=UPI00050A01D7
NGLSQLRSAKNPNLPRPTHPVLSTPWLAAGVELIQSQNDLNDYHEKYLSTNKNFIAEQFISGKMYHCDFIIYDNKAIFKACSEYLFPNLDFKMSKTLSSIPVFNKQIQSVILNFSDQCLRSLGYQNGIYSARSTVSDILSVG